MRPRIPDDLPAEPAAAYRRGWHDRHEAMSKKGGSRRTPAKLEAARANGAKGGRPRKDGKPRSADQPPAA